MRCNRRCQARRERLKLGHFASCGITLERIERLLMPGDLGRCVRGVEISALLGLQISKLLLLLGTQRRVGRQSWRQRRGQGLQLRSRPVQI